MKHPLTWWQQNGVQGRAEVLLFYVLTLLLVVLFVFWASAGWAQNYYICTGSVFGDYTPGDARCIPVQIPPIVNECPQGFACVLSDENDGGSPFPLTSPKIHQQTDCEQRMEAAMRAMDDWRPYLPDANGVTTLPGSPVVTKEEAIVQWDAVKHECWRQP